MALHSPRQGRTDLKTPFHSPRQGRTKIGQIDSPRQGRSTLVANDHSPRQGRVSLWNDSFTGFWVSPSTTSWSDEGRYLVPHPIPQLKLGDTSLTPFLKDLTITLPWNGKATCAFSLGPTFSADTHVADRQSDLCPPGYGPFAGLVRQHNRSTDRVLTVSVSQAGEVKDFPTFLPTCPSFQNGVLNWGGEDKTGLLEAENQRMANIVLARGDNPSAWAALRGIGTHMGITIEPNFPDHRLRDLNRQGGSPINWADKIGKTYQCGRRWIRRGSAERLAYGPARPHAAPSWKFVDRLNIKTLALKELERPRNTFTIVRFEPRAGVLADPPPFSGGENVVKRHSITLDPPSQTAQLQVLRSSPGGIPPESITWYDSKDNVLGSGPVYVGSGKAARVEANFVPQIQAGGTEYTPYLELVVRGGGQGTNSNFAYTRSDAATVAAQGSHPEYKSIETEQIADASTALASVLAHVAESVRKCWAAQFETPYLNPFVEPGQTIEIVHFRTRISSVWFIEKVIYKWSGRVWSMVLECTRGVF